MNQHDQMRQRFEHYRDQRNKALEDEGVRTGSLWHITNAHWPTWQAAQQALAAERLPLVRLTEQEAKVAYQRGIDESENRGIQSAAHWLGLKTVMDAMERVNK